MSEWKEYTELKTLFTKAKVDFLNFFVNYFLTV